LLGILRPCSFQNDELYVRLLSDSKSEALGDKYNVINLGLFN